MIIENMKDIISDLVDMGLCAKLIYHKDKFEVRGGTNIVHSGDIEVFKNAFVIKERNSLYVLTLPGGNTRQEYELDDMDKVKKMIINYYFNSENKVE